MNMLTCQIQISNLYDEKYYYQFTKNVVRITDAFV